MTEGKMHLTIQMPPSSRSLRRGKDEIPDFYPQRDGQKEDELTEDNVKRGFSNIGIGSFSAHECSSARDKISQVPISKFAAAFNNILSEKQKCNTIQDTKRKPSAQNKELFSPITSKTRGSFSDWLRDLAGSKPLTLLATKKVPVFNKKEELLNSMCEHNVPLVRATWFIKMTSAHQMALVSESRNKKRQATEPAQEWTSTITKYMKDQLNKLNDYHQPFSRMTTESDVPQKQWNYMMRLTDWLYEENLLDRQEFFQWLVEQMDKIKNDDIVLKLILPIVLRYLDQIVHSQVLSRTLAMYCARKLSVLLSAAEQMRDEQKQNQLNNAPTENESASPSTITTKGALEGVKLQPPLFSQYKGCSQHQSLVSGFSCILQVITICCPGALIWNPVLMTTSKPGSCNEQSKRHVPGSALDKLALSPSELPLPSSFTSPVIRKQIEDLLISKEEEIKARSKAVERKWAVDSNRKTVMDASKVLEILEYLDEGDLQRPVNVDLLYTKVFGELPENCLRVSAMDQAVTILLIHWATTSHRVGKFRVIVATRLIKKRLQTLRDQEQNEVADEQDEASSKVSQTSQNIAYFQNIALKYLDNYAPIWGDDEENDSRFRQLIMLYGELIRLDIFSHNSYMCTLISRGDLEPASASQIGCETTPDCSMRMDCRNQEFVSETVIEESRRSSDSASELNKQQLELDHELRLHREQLQKLLYQDTEPPDDGLESPFATTAGFKFDEFRNEKPSQTGVSVKEPSAKTRGKSRHDLYVKHFPIMGEENTHELNQRLVLLYGVGKPRNVATKSIKDFGKELVAFVKELGEFDGNDLEDDAMKHLVYAKQAIYSNIPDLLDFLVELLETRNEVNYNPNVPQETSVYGTLPTKSLLVLAALQKHIAVLLLDSELALKTFFGLLRTVENISDPAFCTSSERCVLTFLYHLYTGCAYVKNKSFHSFDTACNRIKETICYSATSLVPRGLQWDSSPILDTFLEDSRREKLDVIWKHIISPENVVQLYSVVCNAFVNVAMCQDRERTLYDIGVLCAEITAHFRGLSSQWITAVKALCCLAGSADIGYIELHDEIDINESSMHECICTFMSILISRSCFSLDDLIEYALLPALKAAVDENNKVIPEAVGGAQLTCQLLYRLLDCFQTSSVSPYQGDRYSCETSPDSVLLSAAQKNVEVKILFAVLKALMKFSEAEYKITEPEGSFGYFNNMDDLIDVVPGQSSDVFSMSSKTVIETTNVCTFANSVVQKLCSQDWLKENCLRNEKFLFSPEGLLDPEISEVQAKKLLYFMCHPSSSNQSFGVNVDSFPPASALETANKVLQNLDQWSFRNSVFELSLLLKRSEDEKTDAIADSVSSACINLFVKQGDCSYKKSDEKQEDFDNGPESLIEPLLKKLPQSLHGRLLKAACSQVLGVKGWWKDQNGYGGSTLIHTQPFLQLILSCLQTLDDQRETLLQSLLRQFQDLVEAPIQDNHPLDQNSKKFLKESLDLRLRLVGVMFDSIANPKNLHLATEWTVVLFHLISSGILTIANSHHYTNILDMLSVLINLIISTESSTNQVAEDGRKFSSGLFKKMKRVLVENPRDIDNCKQLLPFPGRSIEVVTVEKRQQNDFSVVSESQPSTLENDETSEGLQVKGRQKISPWELIEGNKNPAPMLFSWFGAVRLERKPLPHETDLPRTRYHNFVQRKPLSYYLNPTDDSDDDSLDLLTGSQSPALKLQTPIEQKGLERQYSSMVNLTESAKRERLDIGEIGLDSLITDNLSSPKRPKTMSRPLTQLHQQHPQHLQIPLQSKQLLQRQQFQKQQQQLLQRKQFHQQRQLQQQQLQQQQQIMSLSTLQQQQPQNKLPQEQQSTFLNKLSAQFPPHNTVQSQIDGRRFQTTQPSQFAGVPQNVFIAKSQGDNLRPQRPGIPIMSNKTLVNKAPPNVKVLQNRGSIHFNNIDNSMQQILQSGHGFAFTSNQNTQLISQSGLSASNTIGTALSAPNTFATQSFSAANSVQTSQQLQTLAHQKSLNQESLQQTFMMSQLNSSQSTTPLQHPSTGSNSLRMNPLIAVQKPYTQPGIDLNNILRQSGVSCSSPVTTQVSIQRQISAPAKIALTEQLTNDLGLQGQISQAQNLNQTSQNQQYPNFQPPFH
ncbi:mediator of RNA polymerase II transcription subunit 12-like protein isoform X2 [Xenia sp. Carnegie-2017]|uniref:mediator of RNA polymerase II transcription subunit 12-like protein isoform X2 n=1 Tax=Xenia sp. Carnegie-2017 TaxID=2897299 RepID=UPI001F049E92|nr:mediator of RNA polymerase II transcription subunit 12-like protein isoform X2 [Xenia sp. Carnegie-2017]